MIKIEINKEGAQVQIERGSIIVYSEMGTVNKRFYEVLKEAHGEEKAKELMRRMLEISFLTDEESEKEKERIRREKPHIVEAIEKLREAGILND